MLNEYPESFAKFVFAGDTNIQVKFCKKFKKTKKILLRETVSST